MRVVILCFVFFLVFKPFLILCQNYNAQVLNKEATFAINSNLQDYDNDGDLDIIIGQREPDGLFWLENEPNQQFPKKMIFNNFERIATVSVADVDQDGLMDYVIGTENASGSKIDAELVWIQRQADGQFIKWTIDSGESFLNVAVADFNADRYPDVVATRPWVIPDGEVKIYLNNQNLFFSETTVKVNGLRRPVDVGDLDGDGDVDIVVGGAGTVLQFGGSMTLLNDGLGTFSYGDRIECTHLESYDCGAWGSIKIADLNQDNKADILGLSSSGLGPGLYWLDGANDFERTYLDLGLQEPYLDGDFVILDIDANGFRDIVGQSEVSDLLYVYWQTTPMVFERDTLEENWNNGGNPVAKMSVGDLNRDGFLDLVFPEQGITDGDLSWFENINGELHRHELYSFLNGPQTPKLVDVDEDGDLDIVLTVSERFNPENELILYENLDGQNFINWKIDEELDFAYDVETADIDGDGDPDLVATARDANDLFWFENTGKSHNWFRHQIEGNANEPLGCAVADMDGDGDIDVALTSSGDDKVFWYQNDGKGGFAKRLISPQLDAPEEVELADLDGDGDIDAVVSCTSGDNSVAIFLNPGDQNFLQTIIHTGQETSDIEIGDWSGDGRPDVLASFYSNGNQENADIIVFENTETGFVPQPLLYDGERTTSIRLANLNGDASPDLVYGQHSIFDSGIFEGINDGGQLQNPQLTTVEFDNQLLSNGLDVGDINSDGFPDIVYADFNNGDLVVLTAARETVASTSPNILVEEAGLFVYPNPAKTFLYLKMPLAFGNHVSYTITNLNGQPIVFNNRVLLGEENLQIMLPADLPNGIYYLNLETNDQSRYQSRFVIADK